MKFDPGDPKWAAYVLSELDAKEAARVEEEIESSPEARETVKSLRRTAAFLGLALENLPPLGFSPEQRRVIEEAPRQESGIRTSRGVLAAAGVFAALAIVALGVALVLWLPGGRAIGAPIGTLPAAAVPETRLEVNTPPTNSPTSLAISPDGRMIVYAAMAEGKSGLWIRPLDTVSSRFVTGGDSTHPFWSPDGRSLGFFSEGKLNRIGIEGGSPLVLADVPGGNGGSWGPDGTILFAGAATPVFRISASGGLSTAVTQVQTPQLGHSHPQFLPDGDHFLYFAQGSPEQRGVYVGRISGPETRRLLDADSAATYLDSGYLLFVRQSTLLAQPFDNRRLSLTGPPSVIAEGVIADPDSGAAALSASVAGSLVFRTAAEQTSPQPVEPNGVAFSPDGKWIAFQSSRSGRTNIWVRPLTKDQTNQVSPDGGRQPVWSADGRSLFWLDRNGQMMGTQITPDSNGDTKVGVPTPLFSRENGVGFLISPDGRSLITYRPAGPIVVVLNWKPSN